MTARWSEAQVPANDWSRNPRFRTFGRFVLMRPADSKEAGLVVGVLGNPPHPSIWVSDDGKSGRPTEFTLCDAATNSVTLADKNGDGLFEVLALFNTNGCYRDIGLTGKWKFRPYPRE